MEKVEQKINSELQQLLLQFPPVPADNFFSDVYIVFFRSIVAQFFFSILFFNVPLCVALRAFLAFMVRSVHIFVMAYIFGANQINCPI